MPRTARDQSATGIYHVMIRDAVIKACGLRSISDFQLLTLERRKSVIQEVMQSLDVRPRQLSRVTGMNYETIRNIAKKLPWKQAPIPRCLSPWLVRGFWLSSEESGGLLRGKSDFPRSKVLVCPAGARRHVFWPAGIVAIRKIISAQMGGTGLWSFQQTISDLSPLCCKPNNWFIF